MSGVPTAPVALITGGKGDLAKALTVALENTGWRVNAPGREALDVTDREAVSAYFKSLERLDALICNAAILRDELVVRTSSEDWDAVLDTILGGSFRVVRGALSLMMRQRTGHIIFIGSHAGRSGTAGQTSYGAAKAALLGLSASIAREYGTRNVRSNVVLPGYLETRMNRHLPATRVDAVCADHALGRFNTVEESARFIAFLAGMENISGQAFNLDSRISRWT